MTDVCCNELYGNNLSFLCVGFIEYEKSTCTAYSLVLTEKEDFESQLSKVIKYLSMFTNDMPNKGFSLRKISFYEKIVC